MLLDSWIELGKVKIKAQYKIWIKNKKLKIKYIMDVFIIFFNTESEIKRERERETNGLISCPSESNVGSFS